MDLEDSGPQRENPAGSHFWKDPRVVKVAETESKLGCQKLKSECVFNGDRVSAGKIEHSRGGCGRLCMLLSSVLGRNQHG